MTFGRSTRRRLTGFLVMLSLLFSQLALAAYVCPAMSDTAAMAETMAAGEPCAGMDTDQPVLCHQYSAGASLSIEQVKLASPSLPAVVQVLIVPLVLVSESEDMPPLSAPGERPPPDPVFLATRRLRV